VYCQLDTLRRCMPSSIRKALDSLPLTLDDTYERMLQGIPKEKFEHASRLFQCMVAALRPLRVNELAELFAIDFNPNNAPNLVAGWRPENPEEAVLSTCSSFITIIDGWNSKIVQFSHFSVKEYLTSDRLQTSSLGRISLYYIPLEPARAILARACVTVLLQLDEKEDEKDFMALPLASYATRNWVRHARFGDVASRIQDSLTYLFNPQMPLFRSPILLRSFINFRDLYPMCFVEPDEVPPLSAAAFWGFSGLARHLIMMHAADVNAKCAKHGLSPLHVASMFGQVDFSRVLLECGANVNAHARYDWTPLHFVSTEGYIRVAQLLLEHKAISNTRNNVNDTPLHLASRRGHLEIVQLLLHHGADVAARGQEGLTPYQIATRKRQGGGGLKHYRIPARKRRDEIAKLLLEHGAERE